MSIPSRTMFALSVLFASLMFSCREKNRESRGISLELRAVEWTDASMQNLRLYAVAHNSNDVPIALPRDALVAHILDHNPEARTVFYGHFPRPAENATAEQRGFLVPAGTDLPLSLQTVAIGGEKLEWSTNGVLWSERTKGAVDVYLMYYGRPRVVSSGVETPDKMLWSNAVELRDYED